MQTDAATSKRQLADSVALALKSIDCNVWSKLLALPRDDVIRAIVDNGIPAQTRSLLFAKLKDIFPDLSTASLCARQCKSPTSSIACAEDIYALAIALVNKRYNPELNRCLRIDAAILGSLIELRSAVYKLEGLVTKLSTQVYSDDCAAQTARSDLSNAGCIPVNVAQNSTTSAAVNAATNLVVLSPPLVSPPVTSQASISSARSDHVTYSAVTRKVILDTATPGSPPASLQASRASAAAPVDHSGSEVSQSDPTFTVVVRHKAPTRGSFFLCTIFRLPGLKMTFENRSVKRNWFHALSKSSIGSATVTVPLK